MEGVTIAPLLHIKKKKSSSSDLSFQIERYKEKGIWLFYRIHKNIKYSKIKSEPVKAIRHYSFNSKCKKEHFWLKSMPNIVFTYGTFRKRLLFKPNFPRVTWGIIWILSRNKNKHQEVRPIFPLPHWYLSDRDLHQHDTHSAFPVCSMRALDMQK